MEVGDPGLTDPTTTTTGASSAAAAAAAAAAVAAVTSGGGGRGRHGPRDCLISSSSASGKRKQHCTYCKNHGYTYRKTNHRCKYERCECLLCQLTRVSRLIMRHQQRLWRHLKDARRREEGRGDVLVDAAASNVGGGGGVMGGGGGGGVGVMGGGGGVGVGASSKQQKCDMCRNHGEMREKRAHKNACPFQNCDCALCGLTRKRRDIMRHQQRVRRSQVIASQQATQEKDEAYAYVIQATRELAQLSLDAALSNTSGLLPSIDTALGISQGLLPSQQQQQQQQGGGGGGGQVNKGHLKDTGSCSSSSSSSSSPPPPPLPSSSSSGPPPPSTPSLSITTSPNFPSLSLSTSPSASCRSSPVLPSTCSSLCDSQPLDSLVLSDHHLDSHSMDRDLDLRTLPQFTSPSGVAKGTVVGGGGGSGVWRNLKREREEMLGSSGGSVGGGTSSSSSGGSGSGCGSFGGIGSSLSAALPLVRGGGDFAGYGGVGGIGGGGGGRELVMGSSSSCSSPSSCLPHPSLPPSPVPSITSNSPIVCHKKTRLFSPTQDHQHLPLSYNSSAYWHTAHNPLDAFATSPFTHTTYSRHLASAGISSAGLSSAGLSSTGPSLSSASIHAPNRIRSPPGLIPLPTHQQPIRPRPIPLPRHPPALTPGMTDWDPVSLPYLAYSLLHTRALPPTHLGLCTAVRPFFPPSVP